MVGWRHCNTLALLHVTRMAHYTSDQDQRPCGRLGHPWAMLLPVRALLLDCLYASTSTGQKLCQHQHWPTHLRRPASPHAITWSAPRPTTDRRRTAAAQTQPCLQHHAHHNTAGALHLMGQAAAPVSVLTRCPASCGSLQCCCCPLGQRRGKGCIRHRHQRPLCAGAGHCYGTPCTAALAVVY